VLVHDASPSSHDESATAFDEGVRPAGAVADADAMEELFDAPSRWRAQAAMALGLRDEELLGAVSPGAGCPAVIASVLASLTPPDGRLDTVVDIGAGVGGISEWLRRRTKASVVAIEPAAGAREAALTLFPALSVRPGSATATGLVDATADAVVMCGVLSLIADEGAVLAEAERIVRLDGTLAVADLFSARPASITSGPNVFRSFERVAAALAVRGWAIEELGCGTPAPDPEWAAGAERVDEWIHRTRRDHPAYAAWCADRRHLDRHLDAGDLVAGCIVARRRS
jgi:precorrin-6B methylase 2